MSPSCSRAWGFSPLELIQRPLSDLLSPDELQQFKDGLVAAQQKSGEISIAVKLKRPDGAKLDTVWRTEWSSTERLYFAIVQDKTAEMQIQRLKDEFTAVVSHDLKAPLANIGWIIGLLEQGIYGDLGEKAQRKLSIARQNTSYLADIVGDLIELHRLDTVMPGLEWVSTDFHELVLESTEAVSDLAEQKGIHIEVHVSSEQVEVDAIRIKRVLVNLLSNAIKFSPEKSQIIIESRSTDAELHVSITDEGCGIEAAYLPDLFDRFCHIGNKAARRDGSGLGLFICKSLVESHGGSIEAKSNSGSGTTFTFTLPKHQAREIAQL